MKRYNERRRTNVGEYLPLFEQGRERQGPVGKAPASHGSRLEWARLLLVDSGLETFTVDGLRRMVARFIPDQIGLGLWLGSVFQSPLFEKVGPVNSGRPEAKGRTIWEYKLSEAGRVLREARRQLRRTNA